MKADARQARLPPTCKPTPVGLDARHRRLTHKLIQTRFVAMNQARLSSRRPYNAPPRPFDPSSAWQPKGASRRSLAEGGLILILIPLPPSKPQTFKSVAR